jgi:hypothetical protein
VPKQADSLSEGQKNGFHTSLPSSKSVFVKSLNTQLWSGRTRFSYESMSKSSRTESVKKYTLAFGTSRQEATQRVMAAKLIRLTHKIAIQLHLVAESSTTYSYRSRLQVRKLLDIPPYLLRKDSISVSGLSV